jgi:hypothetical protein
MTAAVVGAVQGRPSNAQLTDRLQRSRLRNGLLAEEVRALHYERDAVGSEIEALARRIEYAIGADRPDVAMHVAGRLEALAHSLQRRGAA